MFEKLLRKPRFFQSCGADDEEEEEEVPHVCVSDVHKSFSGPTELQAHQLHCTYLPKDRASHPRTVLILTAIRTSDLTSPQKLTIFVTKMLNM